MWTDDPERDADRYMEEAARWASRFPVCAICGEHIVEGEDYTDAIGEPIHWECFDEKYRRVMGFDY